MEKSIINYIENQLLGKPIDIKLTAEEDLLTSGLIDSLAIMKLIAFLESEFDIKVAPTDMTIENFINVDAMCQYIQAHKTA